jgi:hypothetical protein
LFQKLFEFQNRDPDFQPRTLFDFGSGVGSANWLASHRKFSEYFSLNLYFNRAVTETFGKMTEIFSVDTSAAMNDLARLILMEGRASQQNPAGIFFRMHLPASNAMQVFLNITLNLLQALILTL